MTFAPQYERNEEGLILFPNDGKERDKHYATWKEAGQQGPHPAKANLYLTQELIRYTSEPGDTIMDITAGTGTIMMGALEGRKVIAIELNSEYCDWIKMSREKMGIEAMILNGDCREILPMPTANVKSIVFSPPYATALNSSETGLMKREKGRFAASQQYKQDVRNLGNLNNFVYNQEMEKIYKLCLETLIPGGILSLIIKDRIRSGVREELGLRAMQMMGRVGFEYAGWFRWRPPGTLFTQIHRSHGTKVIDDEHLILMRRPYDSISPRES